MCVYEICSVDSDIKQLTAKILVVTEADAESGSKTFVLKNTTDQEEIPFYFFLEWSVVKYQHCKPTQIWWIAFRKKKKKKLDAKILIL